jgi:hypothetical protein
MDGQLMTASPTRVESYLYYDMHGKNELEPRDPRRSDACSFIYSICKNTTSLQNVLTQATAMSEIGEIILIVQPCDATENFKDEVHKLRFPNLRVQLLSMYDRNTRFLQDDLKYDCVIHADEDSAEVPPGVTRSYEFFKNGYFDRLIGSTDVSAVANYDTQ